MSRILRILVILLFCSSVFGQVPTKYIIKNVEDVTEAMLLAVKQKTTKDCTPNKAGTKIILKWDGFTSSIFKDEKIYNYITIHEEIKKPEWSGYTESGSLGKYFVTNEYYSVKINDCVYVFPTKVKRVIIGFRYIIPEALYNKYKEHIEVSGSIKTIDKNSIIKLQ